ncbi:MAG TPA: hypothetical protein ENI27_04615 [bacterium]|nr:hypothetical protein [bacterium]
MNEFDRKKFVVYEQSLARFVDYLRKYSYEIKEEIHGNRSYIKSNSDDLSGLIDMSEKIESDLKQIHIDLNHQNSNMDQFRTEIRTSLERGFTELRERIKKLKNGEEVKVIKDFDELSVEGMKEYIKKLKPWELQTLKRYFPDDKKDVETKKLPDEEPLRFTKAKEITDGPGPILIPVDMSGKEPEFCRRKNDPKFDGPIFSKPGDNTITIPKIKGKMLNFFGIGRLRVEL